MNARFRIRTRDDRELRPETLEALSALVAAGQVHRDDLMYDALTGEWAPAWAHPVYHLVTDPLVDEEGESVVPEPAAGAAPTVEGTASASAGPAPSPAIEASADPFQLVDAPETSPEEETRAFLAEMAAERAADTEEPALAREMALTDARPLAHFQTEEVEDAGVGSTPDEAGRPSDGPGVTRDEAEVGPGLPPRRVSGPVVVPSRPRRSRARKRVWAAVALLVVVGTAVTAAVAHPDLRFGDTLPRRADAAPAPRSARGEVRADEASLRVRAWDGFVERADALRRDMGLTAVPEGWLGGAYLAGAAARPDVRDFWSQYLRYLERVHAADADFYRDAYLDALDGSGVAGPVRSLRLAGAVAEFEAASGTRDLVYARAWELAAAAEELHRLLVELDGRISYEPARGERVSLDPVLEAAGTDADAQERLEAALDRVLLALHGSDGRGDPDTVLRWVARGLEGVGPGA